MAQSTELEDRAAVADVIHEVARLYDEKRHADLNAIFTDDAEILYRYRGQRIDFSPPDGYKILKSFHDLCYFTQHLVSPHVLSVEGDRATARSPVHALHLQIRNDGSQNYWVIGATYSDEFQRVDGRWRMRKRLCVCPWIEGEFLSEGVRAYPTLPDYDVEEIAPPTGL